MIEPKKTISVLLACLALLGLFFVPACSPLEEDDHIAFLVGVSQANLIDPWQIRLKEEIAEKAAEYSDVKVIYADAGSSNEKQENDISDMLIQQVDLIIIFPNDVDYISDALSKAYEDGTDIILLGHPTEETQYSSRIFTDNHKIGRMAGEYASELLGGEGVVLELQGDPENVISKERKEGFLEAIDAYPRIVKEYVTVGNWSRDYAEAVLTSSGLLEREINVDLVFAHNDEMAIGASRLIKRINQDVFVIGVDGLGGKNRGLEAVNTGDIDATITYPTGGRQAMGYAMKLLNGEKIPKEIELPTQLITVNRENE